MKKVVLFLVILLLVGCNGTENDPPASADASNDVEASDRNDSQEIESSNPSTNSSSENSSQMIEGVVMEINRDDNGNLIMMVNEGTIEISDVGDGDFGFRLDPDSWVAIDFTDARVEVIEIVQGYDAMPNLERLGDVNDIQLQQPVRIQLSESKLDDNTLIAASIIVYHGLGPATFE